MCPLLSHYFLGKAGGSWSWQLPHAWWLLTWSQSLLMPGLQVQAGCSLGLISRVLWGARPSTPEAHSSVLSCSPGFLHPGSWWRSPLAQQQHLPGQHTYKMLPCFRQSPTQFWACNVKVSERNKHNFQNPRNYKTWVSLCRSPQTVWFSNKYRFFLQNGIL